VPLLQPMAAPFALVRAFVIMGGDQMKVLIFGATGMVGQGVLRECLRDADVESVLAISRNPSLPHHDKLCEILHKDVSDLSAREDRFSG
jgi:putative NADH-flavin reductase